MRIDGVDISHHQSPKLDFKAAKAAGVKWVYHKATEGTTIVDSNYTKRRGEVASAGLPFGAYHFARPGRGDAVIEAKKFLTAAKVKTTDLRPMLDLETNDGNVDLNLWVDEFVKTVYDSIGAWPIIYTKFDLPRSKHAKKCLLWVARYNDDNRAPNTPKPWAKWDIWQFSDGNNGTPDLVAGLGHVDLNTMRDGLTVSDMKFEKKPDTSVLVNVAHCSMQFKDPAPQQRADAKKIFARAKERNWMWITGTEAGPGAGKLPDILRSEAKKAGFKFFVPKKSTDAWVAVNKKFVSSGWKTGYIPVIPGSNQFDNPDRRWGPKGVVWVEFDNDDLGHFAISASHYLTGASEPGSASQHGDVNHWTWNKKLALTIGDWAKEKGKGGALAFYGGDQNMVDSKNDEPQGDTFFGAPLTSLWDELGKWENTGHGNIDVIASYNRDGRVVGQYIQALDDSEFKLFTDHFLVEGGFKIRKPRKE